ncbi:MAG: hypothetical protein K6B71_03985 [Alphaproteobacteria bacterium]|nr:hypothetical protein [Alphaproteobacteria bacterium]
MKIKVKNFVFAGFAAAIFAGHAMAAGDTIVTSKAYVDQKLGLKANTADLAPVATSGSYTDLTNTPSIPAAQVNADWDATSGVAQILNKPTLSAVATSGSYNDLSNKPSIPTVPTNVSAFTNDAGYITSTDVPAQVNADWDATSGTAQILNKPTLSAVATSGSYNDLSNKPTIPTVPTNVSAFTNDAGYATTSQLPTIDTELSPVSTNPVQNKVVTSAIASANTNIQNLQRDKQNNIDADNKLSYQYVDGLATVAHSGSYNDLTNKPTIPTAVSDLTNDTGFITSAQVPAQVNADWTATSGTAQILNKPTLAAVATSGNASDLTQDATHRLVTDTEKATWNAKQDAIGDLSDIRSGAAAGATAVQPNDLAPVATSGSYTDLSNTPSIPAAQVQSDWNATTGMGAILNKPTLSAVATSGNYSDLSGTPTLATVATTGDYDDLSNKPTIPAAQVQSNWTETNTTSKAYIQNKPTLGTAAAADTSAFATAAQGAKADTAIQPGNCTENEPCALVNNAWVRIAQVGD